LGRVQVGLYRIFFYFEVFVHESIPPHPPALPTLLQYDRAGGGRTAGPENSHKTRRVQVVS